MAFKIDSHLEKAKLIHRLPSDYKLALVMGISQSALTNYRQGKTLPDARVISILCGLTGDDPAILLAQIEEVRAKTTEARALWHQVVERLRAGAVAAIFAAVTLGASGLFAPGVSEAAQRSGDLFTTYTSWNISK